MDKDKILDLLETADWKDIILRLTHYAYGKASKYSWVSRDPNKLPGGKTPEDIALSAVQKVWNGERDWNPNKHPKLLTHLMWIVNSDINHLINSAEHKKSAKTPINIDEVSVENANGELLHGSYSPMQLASKIGNPEEQLIAFEDNEYQEKVKKEFYAKVAGDEDLEMLLLFFEEGEDKPETIAAQMGWEIQKVYNLKRKLLRKATKFNEIIRKIK